MKKVIFASSSGGHLTELLSLEKLFNEYSYLVVTEKTSVTEKLKTKYNMEFLMYGSKYYPLKYFFVLIFNVIKTIKILLKFKPDTVVSTGAHTGGIVCFFAHLFKVKVIYIETLAMTETLSVTGKNMYKIADEFYVQWESLTKSLPKAKYLGRLM